MEIACVISLLIFSFSGNARAAPEEDRVFELPHMAKFDDWAFYSGYLPTTLYGQSLHYLFVESQNSPEDDPLIIWFNGGPGCSSMIGFA